MADIQKIKEKLAALLARARDNGSSEAEVNACLTRAQKLMEEYGVTEEDVDKATANDFRDYSINVPEGQRKHDPVVRYCAPAVGRLTGVTFYINNASGKGDQSPIVAFGLDADVEYALWLMRSLRHFMDDQWATYRDFQLDACTRDELKAERIGFVRGFCNTVCDRINWMVADNAAGGVGTGTSLVVKKNDLVTRELKNRGINLGRGRSMNGRGYGSAHGAHAGAAAGQSASLGRGVGQNRAAIGKA